jgi:hypothetical protein
MAHNGENTFDEFFNVDKERARVKAIRDEILHGRPKHKHNRVCGCIEFEAE